MYWHGIVNYSCIHKRHRNLPCVPCSCGGGTVMSWIPLLWGKLWGYYPRTPKTWWGDTVHFPEGVQGGFREWFFIKRNCLPSSLCRVQCALLFTIDNVFTLIPLLPIVSATCYCLLLKPYGWRVFRMFPSVLWGFNITLTLLLTLKDPGANGKASSAKNYGILNHLQITLQTIC